ncbi:MAG TPA: S8 family serine peptidase, partial [Phycicoccus sp.]|nr:S8 family serine peptidase [Phycicoccus sp.]
DALAGLILRQELALAGKTDDPPIDVLSLSLGYHHETPGAFADESLLRSQLERLSELGVVVVAGAGNNSSNVPFYPAAFAVPGASGAPLVSVGARTTSGKEVAIWSNTGTWVTTYGPGNAIVSTMPTAFNGSRRSGIARAAGPGQPARGGSDRDDFRSGFGVWSGTSFATPALAGEVAAVLGDLAQARDAGDRVKHARQAVETVLKGTDAEEQQ